MCYLVLDNRALRREALKQLQTFINSENICVWGIQESLAEFF